MARKKPHEMRGRIRQEDLPLEKIAEVFRAEFKHEVSRARREQDSPRLPRALQCGHVRNVVLIVNSLCRPAQHFKRSDGQYVRDQRVLREFTGLILRQKKVARLNLERIERSYPLSNLTRDYVEQPLHRLTQLETILATTKGYLVQEGHPEWGERLGAWWHWPAKFIAKTVRDALTLSGAPPPKVHKNAPYVRVVADLLELATGYQPEPGATAAVLRTSN